MTASAPTIDERLSQLKNIRWSGESKLPVPPQSVIEFSARARQPNVSVADLSSVVECEPALTTELLRNVNSCMHGLRNKVDSIPQAISLLGIPNSTTILLTSALANAVERNDSPLVPNAIHRRETVERSVFARQVAKQLRLDPTLAYTAAMLQDILLPILVSQYQVEYHKYLHDSDCPSLVDFELETFGWTHPQLTAKTLLKWGFSEPMAIAVMQHHDSPETLLVQDQKPNPAFPGACSGLLMDVMRQSPDGVTRLVDLQGMDRRLNLIEIANAVDESMKELGAGLQNPVSLVHRIQNAMLEQLDTRRKQAIIPGRQFGPYILEERLRESSMGAIFLARHARMKRPAAVKILRADRTTTQSIEQFEQEVQLTSTLQHPNTIKIFDYGHTPDDLFYYAMEYIDGMTLGELIKREGRVPDGRVIRLLEQACGSLAEAHELRLIHRDIKPENLMISHRVNQPEHLTVVDFGLVASTREGDDAGRERVKAVVGTPLYMSPEAAAGRESQDARSDLYSLGAVGYFLLTGSPVFKGNTVIEVLQQHMKSTPHPPRERCEARIAPGLEGLIMRCLAKNPAQRPASAQEMLETLRTISPAQPWTDASARAWWQKYRADRPAAAASSKLDESICAATMRTTSMGELKLAESIR